MTWAGWLVALALVPVLARRYAPAKAWGWLALMVAAPWIGLVLFLLFAHNPLGRRRQVRYRDVLGSTRVADREGNAALLPDRAELPEGCAELARSAEQRGALPPSGPCSMELLDGHDQTFPRLLADIDAARHHVHLVYYIIRDDEVGGQIADALRRAAGRGVDCRIVGDAVGGRKFLRRRGDELCQAGVHVASTRKLNPLRARLARLDVRNHRKIAVIDGRVGYLGSWNIMHPRIRLHKEVEYRDLSARLIGPTVANLQLLFLEEWALGSNEKLSADQLATGRSPEEPDARPPDAPGDGAEDAADSPGPENDRGKGLRQEENPGGRDADASDTGPESRHDAVLQLLPSGPLYPESPVRDMTVELLGRARRRVILTSPYFVPDQPVLLALRLAAQRGVEVHVIIPKRSDYRMADAAGRAYAAELAGWGIHVYCNSDQFLHAKTLSIDGKLAMFGSANFDIRSFRLNIEANLLVYTPEAAEAVTRIQERYIEDCSPFDEHWSARSSVGRRIDELAKLASPLV